ncbi:MULTISPECIES: helix-turn-helix domain-containing protein [Burkholderiales]|jgi:hypothetical protein|uniref:helix-turn-helix domain-containing protein n=1 Tax=Burkholderiales TaxID=80840 RepID=UPI0018E9C44A|nr:MULTISPECIES: helix-turn-helix domain-containing protein [Burkholderiales]MBU9223731.1 helix-turn-helix domain-containing protein [Burkholderia multivorans]MCT9074335.1 helix-turn-helix domain-containing protein [Cupriavidus gilardii]
MKPKADATARRAGSAGPDEPPIKYPVLNETQLCSRWNLSPKTLQRWRSEGIGPPAWHINRSVRYLLMEVEAFERKARVTWKSSAGRALSESSPTAREDAIEQMMQQRPARRDQIFYSCKAVADITGLPVYWFQQDQERQRRGIPCYILTSGGVIRFSIEEVFCWEVHHLRPCRSDAGTSVDALQSASS